MTTAAISDEKKIEILNDHYKDTFSQLSKYLEKRERLFSLILVTVVVLLFQLYSPSEANTTIGEFILKKLDLQSTVNIAFVNSVIWFILLGLVVSYFQTIIHIERQYTYVHGLEEQLSKEFHGKAFTREGKSYLKNYPQFDNWMHFIYTLVFPAVLILMVVLKIINEIYSLIGKGISPLLIFNSGIALCIIISTTLYVRAMYFGR